VCFEPKVRTVAFLCKGVMTDPQRAHCRSTFDVRQTSHQITGKPTLMDWLFNIYRASERPANWWKLCNMKICSVKPKVVDFIVLWNWTMSETVFWGAGNIRIGYKLLKKFSRRCAQFLISGICGVKTPRSIPDFCERAVDFGYPTLWESWPFLQIVMNSWNSVMKSLKIWSLPITFWKVRQCHTEWYGNLWPSSTQPTKSTERHTQWGDEIYERRCYWWLDQNNDS
jgi:hypothetical protein